MRLFEALAPTRDEEEAGGPVEVVDPALHGLAPGADHDAGPHDAHGQVAALRHDQLLRDGLGDEVDYSQSILTMILW